MTTKISITETYRCVNFFVIASKHVDFSFDNVFIFCLSLLVGNT